MEKIFKQLLDYINGLEIIDTHEHLPSYEKDRDMDADVIKEYLAHYYNRDLVSAGMPESDYEKIIESKLPVEEKWLMVEPYWKLARYTGYGRCLDISARELYGIDHISGDTITELNDRFRKSLKPGHFEKVLKKKSKIRTCLLNVSVLEKEYNTEEVWRSIYCDRKFFSPVYIINDLVYPRFWSHIEKMEAESGISIASFDNYLEAANILIDKAYKLGAIALKNILAYERTLLYERTTRAGAEEEFNQVFKTKHLPDWGERSLFAGKKFQDYMFHYILDLANRENLVVQIHTGIQEGSGNILENTRPELLTDLFLQYPDVDFDLFHIGYPFQNTIIVLAKYFPNVYIDMCWSHIVSPNASINFIQEFIDTVPLNKLSAFGGDYLFIDGVYGHQYLARINVAKALALKVSDGIFDIDKAKETAKMFFYDNPMKLFRLEGKI